MTKLKTALVVSWPSVDASVGPFSEFEWQVTAELMKSAGFEPDLIVAAYPCYVAKWQTLFERDRIGAPPLQHVAARTAELHKLLEGYEIALTMGPHAMWALTGQHKIDTYRGTHIDSPFVAGLQVVPTYGPDIFARLAWAERPIVVAAMRKATRRFVDQPKAIYLPENIADLYAFSTQHIKNEIVFDVETNMGCRITEFSVATNPHTCLYVQLETRDHRSIWSADDELQIMLWLHFLARRPDLTWVFHNATYDLTYLDAAGIRPAGHISDTMLRHHAWQPEWEKSLGFLTALHVPTRAWKHLRQKSKREFNKAGALE